MSQTWSFVYRIHGPIYHAIGTVENKKGDELTHAQIYLFDTEAAATARESVTNPPCGDPRCLGFAIW